ncbi:hypothetical protein EV182_007518, partial [Spiromyces aspiralis]
DMGAESLTRGGAPHLELYEAFPLLVPDMLDGRWRRLQGYIKVHGVMVPLSVEFCDDGVPRILSDNQQAADVLESNKVMLSKVSTAFVVHASLPFTTEPRERGYRSF